MDTSENGVLGKELALDWVFFELCADALSNSHYMRQTFGGNYVPDFNGQSESYSAELAIAKQIVRSGKLTEPTVEQEYLRFRSGFALVLLRDTMLRKGVLDTIEQADSMVDYLKTRYPFETKIRNGLPIQERVSPLNPAEVQERIAQIFQNRSVDGRPALAEVISIAFAKS